MSELTNLFTSIANSIRGKTGETGAIAASNFASAISAIPTGGTVVHGQLGSLGGGASRNFPELAGYSNFMIGIFLDEVPLKARQQGSFIFMTRFATDEGAPFAYCLFNVNDTLERVVVSTANVQIAGTTITFTDSRFTFPTARGYYIAW